MIAFSKGCTIAAKAARFLEQHGQDAYLFLIDGPAPEVAKQYISQSSLNLTNDIYNMVYTAKSLAGLSEFKASENQNPKEIINLSPIDALRLVAGRVTDLTSPSSYAENEFIKYIKLIERWLYHLARYSSSSLSTGLTCQINAVLTNATTKKYQTSDGGWAKYTSAFALVEENLLANVDHFSLMTNEYCAKLIAQHIMAFIYSKPVLVKEDRLICYKIAKLYSYIVNYCRRSEASSNPDIAHLLRS